MNQTAWKALVEHHDRVSKTFTPRKAEAGFRRNIEAVLCRIPEPDWALLQTHWRMEKEAIHPFEGTKYPAPLFILDTNFSAGGMKDRASGMASSNGCCFVFEERLVYSAPGEVVQSIIAHELAHAWIHAKYHSQNLPLPPLIHSGNEQKRSLEAYPEAEWHEEWLVDEIVTRWGFPKYLLEAWEVAVQDAPKDPRSHYLILKRLAKDNLQALRMPPSKTLLVVA